MNPDKNDRCPICSIDLSPKKRSGVHFGICPRCGTLWVGRGELSRALELERMQPRQTTRFQKAQEETSCSQKDFLLTET